MKTLPFHTTDGFNEDTFEQFCLHMLRLLEPKNSIYKHSTKGQNQSGYDAYYISNNIFYDFKHYVNQPSLSKIKNFVAKFLGEKKNTGSKLKLLFACKVERESRDPNTNNFNALENYLRVNKFLEIWDLEKISQLVNDKRLYSLVLRFFNDTIFKEFFGDPIYHLYFPPNSQFYFHYRSILRSGKGTHSNDLTNITRDDIENEVVFIKESVISILMNSLIKYRFCILQAAEGRGKTVLSRIIAYNKFENLGYDVFFVDFINLNYNQNTLQKFFEEIKNNVQKYLIIFENLHLYEDQSAIIKFIGEYESHENLEFLINSRALDENLKLKSVIYLNYEKNDIVEILKVRSTKSLHRFIDSTFFDRKSKSPNLRLVNMYKNYSKNMGVEIHKIKLLDIYEDFSKPYLLGVKTKQKKMLHKLATLNQFEIPYITIEDNEIDFFDTLVSRNQLIKIGEFYRFNHSIDAKVLAQYLCKNIYPHKTEASLIEEVILDYINNYKGEYNVVSFADLANYLKDEIENGKNSIEVKEYKYFMNTLTKICEIDGQYTNEIVDKINFGFLINVLVVNSLYDKEFRMKEFTQKYVEQLLESKKDRFYMLNSLTLSKIHACLKNKRTYNSNTLPKKLFTDLRRLRVWLGKIDFNGGYLRRIVEDIEILSLNHMAIIGSLPKKDIVDGNVNYCFESIKKNNKNVRINKDFVFRFYSDKNEESLKRIDRDGFYIYATLGSLGKLVITLTILKTSNSNITTICEKILKDLLNQVLLPPNSLKNASEEHLSLFFNNLNKFDILIYENFLNNPNVKNQISEKLQDLTFSQKGCYFLGSICSPNIPWVQEIVQNLLSSADEYLKEELIIFYNIVVSKNITLTIEKNTLLYHIDKILIEPNKNDY